MSKPLKNSPEQAAKLLPVHIAKPWGQEIWYSGMEARGESRVAVDDDQSEPISKYLARLGLPPTILLLKILDPNPEEVLGDLYFELHEEKQEVYVVTHIDLNAWPDGVGAIRYGMNQELLKELGEARFRRDYHAAVSAYADIRRRIDHEGEAVDARTEKTRRAAMDRFTQMRSLRIGDVVKVPTWVPHSLQHGVRVVEFQTQVYERQIISFAQKVVTQDHWDYEGAIKKMTLAHPPEESFETVQQGVQRIASFADFNVWRVACGEQPALKLPSHIPYAICMAIGGTARVGALTLEGEQACIVPAPAIQRTELRGALNTQLLIAAPDL